MTGLLIGPAEIAALANLMTRAMASPVVAGEIVAAMRDPAMEAALVARTRDLRVDLPLGYRVTLTIEKDHKFGPDCVMRPSRHAGISLINPTPEKRLPGIRAVVTITRLLGFSDLTTNPARDDAEGVHVWVSTNQVGHVLHVLEQLPVLH